MNFEGKSVNFNGVCGYKYFPKKLGKKRNRNIFVYRLKYSQMRLLTTFFDKLNYGGNFREYNPLLRKLY